MAISFFRGSSRHRDQTRVSHIVGRHFTIYATRESCLSVNLPPNLIAGTHYVNNEILTLFITELLYEKPNKIVNNF